jgi:hypothetical protein
VVRRLSLTLQALLAVSYQMQVILEMFYAAAALNRAPIVFPNSTAGAHAPTSDHLLTL